RQTAELKKCAVDIGDRAASRVHAVPGAPLDARTGIGADQTVFTLLTRIERPQKTRALHQRLRFTVVDVVPVAGRSRPDSRRQRAGRVDVGFGPKVAADLDANVGPRDEVEACAI